MIFEPGHQVWYIDSHKLKTGYLYMYIFISFDFLIFHFYRFSSDKKTTGNVYVVT